ncbi:ERF family protein [Streptomyces sp. NPDC001691]|uniref:ERF family protein n=1 Tax=Streptomyces sp. NPDC001691 TaxID=3364600 RepID=UPI00369BFF5D
MAETTTDPLPNLDELMEWSVDKAFTAAMREIAPVGKDGTNTHHRYNFRQAEDVVRACSGPMRKYGLKMFPKVISREHQTRGSNNVTVLEVEWVFRGPSGDTMTDTVTTVGEAADVSDKATNKAMTASEKYALLQAFKIEVDAGDLDDGDRDHPQSVRSPIDWYLEQLRRPEVWYSATALRELVAKAESNGMLKVAMPHNPFCTLEEYIIARGRQVVAEMEERDQQRAESREAVQAQMAAEHPAAVPQNSTPPPATPPPAAPPAPQTVSPPPLPTAAEIQERITEAQSDAAALEALRDQVGPDILQQVVIESRWGKMSAAAAIAMALLELGSPPAPPAADDPQETAPEPPKPKRKQRSATEERARIRMLTEAEIQARMLNISVHEHLADVLPAGSVDPGNVASGVALQQLVRDARPDVLAALIKGGYTKAAELYAALGTSVPAPNIDAIVLAVNEAQPVA